jgi:hypothetical protein
MNQYLFKYLEKQEATTPEGDDVYEWQLCVCHEKNLLGLFPKQYHKTFGMAPASTCALGSIRATI